MFCDNNATKLEVLERRHLVIWLDSIFWSLAVWVAEKIPKLWRKDQPFASDVSPNTARDATLRGVVFAVTSTPFNGRLCRSKHIRSFYIAEFISLALYSLFSKEFNTKDIVLFCFTWRRSDSR